MGMDPNNPGKKSHEGSCMTAESGLDGVQGGGARDRKDQHAKGVKCHKNSCAGGWFRLGSAVRSRPGDWQQSTQCRRSLRQPGWLLCSESRQIAADADCPEDEVD
jgi:hypothetical protein